MTLANIENFDNKVTYISSQFNQQFCFALVTSLIVAVNADYRPMINIYVNGMGDKELRVLIALEANSCTMHLVSHKSVALASNNR